ncbi:MAG: hypothetical protein AB1714_27515 [Acidobacteriota bacterium]
MTARLDTAASVILVAILSSAMIAPPAIVGAPKASGAAPAQPSQPIEWPREIVGPKGKVEVYQPQLEEWQDYKILNARAAIAFAPAGSDNPQIGIIELRATTEVDHVSRLVRLTSVQITGGNFPSLNKEQSEKMLAVLRGSISPSDLRSISLDRVLASLERAGAHSIEVRNDPRRIIASYKPAVLVIFDGKPILSPIKGCILKFAVNTNWDLFYDDPVKTYYLRNESSWLQASSVSGPWAPATKLPDGFKKLPKDPNWEDVRANIPGKPTRPEDVPAVFVSEQPAELILIKGAPALQPIPHTTLLWVTNTESNLFFAPADNYFYYLVSGRWFRARSLEGGEWVFATPILPADFKNIPADHPRGEVRSSVPGTREAEEAVIQASIPQTAQVNKKEIKAPNVYYAGDKPDFKPIEGTSLTYAVNTGSEVIQYQGAYYLCYEAVWFVSGSPSGPWQVAETIPAEIYKIPPSSPVYHVTYVTVVEDDHSDDWVKVAVLAGYFGTIITADYVVWGTGWYYPPYVYYGPHYPIYFPYYPSYGACAWYNPYTGTFGRAGRAYGPYAGVGFGAAYNPVTGTYARGAAAYGPYGAAGWAEAYNPRTGTYARTRQGTNYYSSWGTTAVRRGDDWVRSAHYTGSEGGAMGYRTSDGNRGLVGYKGDDLYAGRDGNVYKHTDDGWQKYDNGNWAGVQKPARPEAVPATTATRQLDQDTFNQLDRDQFRREEGTRRTQKSQSWEARTRPSSSTARKR